jgi:hypothetical protein
MVLKRHKYPHGVYPTTADPERFGLSRDKCYLADFFELLNNFLESRKINPYRFD